MPGYYNLPSLSPSFYLSLSLSISVSISISISIYLYLYLCLSVPIYLYFYFYLSLSISISITASLRVCCCDSPLTAMVFFGVLATNSFKYRRTGPAPEIFKRAQSASWPTVLQSTTAATSSMRSSKARWSSSSSSPSSFSSPTQATWIRSISLQRPGSASSPRISVSPVWLRAKRNH